jgi:hypothetical protein
MIKGTHMENIGFVKIDNWYLNENGKLDINFPPSISNTSGVVAIVVNDEPCFFSSTIHYGPKIKDFKHAKSGNNTNSRIHSEIIEALKNNATVSTWVKDCSSPSIEKIELIKTYNPKWNL